MDASPNRLSKQFYTSDWLKEKIFSEIAGFCEKEGLFINRAPKKEFAVENANAFIRLLQFASLRKRRR
jgi:hypothetical protein